MTNYDRMKRKRLGDILVDEGLATGETVIAALQEQQRTGKLLSDVLLDQRQVSEHDLARAIVEHYQVPYISLAGYAAHKDLIQQFPAALLNRARVVPLDRYGKQVCFACQEIPPKECVDELRRLAPSGVYFYIASAVDIRKMLADHAPVAKAAPAPAAKAPAAAAAPGKSAPKPAVGPEAEENAAWKDLFDAANESILTELKVRED